MYNKWRTSQLTAVQIEHGIDFITIYTKNLTECNMFAQKLFNKLNKKKFIYMDLQRKNFIHMPNDPAHFHADGGAAEYWKYYRHFHVIYPHKPTEEDWKYLMAACNDKELKLVCKAGLPTRYVKEAVND